MRTTPPKPSGAEIRPFWRVRRTAAFLTTLDTILSIPGCWLRRWMGRAQGGEARRSARRQGRPAAKPHSRLPPSGIHLSTHGGPNAPPRRAVAACRCPEPTACSLYPAIQGCSTRSTRSCGSRRTRSRSVFRRPSSSSRAGCGILNQFMQTCNSKLFLALR